MTKTGVTLETSAEERAKWTRDVIPGASLVGNHWLARLIRDFDRVIADNEAKAAQIVDFQREYQDSVSHREAIENVETLKAELARLKSRPTSEEVEEMANDLDEVCRAQGLTQAGVRAGKAAALLRRLAAQGDGWRPIKDASIEDGEFLSYHAGRFGITHWNGGWITYGKYGMTYTNPSYFMPLPSPPSPPSTEDKT